MERVIFKKNPLVEVILQFRFPTILSINTKEPADFQELIRADYPIYQAGIENQQEIQIVANNDIFLPSIINKQQNKNYAFVSADGKYKINLTSSFISISTIEYTRWEEFYGHFKNVLNSFISVYKPPFFERIGLRYIDAISRKSLNLENRKWKDLIKENWLCSLSIVDEKQVIIMNSDTELVLPDNTSRLKIHTGLGNIKNSSEHVFIVDTDFIHINNIKLEEYDRVLESLHDQSRFFIENVITTELYEAMEPIQIQ